MDDMNESLRLLSTMSPKVKNNKKLPRKKVTKLALKNQIRRSSIYGKLSPVKKAVLLTESESTETVDTSSENSYKPKQEPIVISDSTLSDNKIDEVQDENVPLPSYKFQAISKWVSKVNVEHLSHKQHENDKIMYNASLFSEISAIYEDKRKLGPTDNNVAANSTFANGDNYLRFDELFCKVDDKKETDNSFQNVNDNLYTRIKNKHNIEEKRNFLTNSKKDLKCGKLINPLNIIQDSFEAKKEYKSSENNKNNKSDIIIIDDSFNEKTVSETNSEKTPPKKNEGEYENILDKLYGNSWRINREKILSNPGPDRKTKVKKTRLQPPCTDLKYKNPYLESEQKKSNNLLRTLQSARMKLTIESPMMKTVKNLCDSESNSNDDEVQTRFKTKLKFDDSDTESEPKSLGKKTEDKIKKKDTIKGVPKKSKNIIRSNSNSSKSTKSSSSIDISDKENITCSDDVQYLEIKLRKKLNINERDNADKIKKKINSQEKILKKVVKKKQSKFIESSSSESSDSLHKDKYLKEISIKKKELGVSNEKKSIDKGPLSFLASLSASVSVFKCDPSAKLFRECFKSYKTELAMKLFKLYNEKIFNNAIPNDTPLKWNDRMRGTAGFCYCKKVTRRTGAIERAVRIELATKIIDSADRLRDTLVHEMCHAATWVVNEVSDGHGDFWKSWARKAMNMFPELPPIKRCHDYVINTKYTYKCTSCGYSIGRHSKSLDTERKRCGHCYGTFELLINKTTKSGVQSVPVTPKKEATGFALFVKQNYASCKTPTRNHADVMKILSKNFTEKKKTNSERNLQ